MITRWAGALGAALLLAGAVPRAAQAADRPKIMVMPVAGHGDPTFRMRAAQAISEGLLASGGEVVATPGDAGYLVRSTVEEEGRSYTFKLEMVDAKSGELLAQRENRCEICTDAEALETANTAASALKTQAFKRPLASAGVGGPPAPAAPAPRATGPRARVTVFDRLELPASLAEFHGKLRTSLEALIREQGLEVVTAPPLPANCAWAGCAEDLIRGAGASHVLFVEGSRNDYGFNLDLTLRSVAGDESEKAQGWCNFCTGPQMVTAAENVARPLLVHLAARPEPRAAGAAVAAGGGGAAAGEGQGGSSARLVAGIGLMAAGAAAIAVGAVTWHRDGQLTDCIATGADPCISMRDGKGLGIALVIGGAVATVAGGWLAFFRNTQVSVTQNSVGVSGRF